MRLRPSGATVLAISALALGAATATADDGAGGRAIDTDARYTPIERFDPLSASSQCVGAPSGRDSDPFVLPVGPPQDYDQVVVAEEPQGGTRDLWDMNTQNEFGRFAGRYVYRTHETGNGSQVSVTDLLKDETDVLAERSDWERFDGIVWTPYGTILAAEETSSQALPDPDAPQARGGLVYELYVDRDDPGRLDPEREPQGTATLSDDGTSDTVQDGIRVRPALGAKSHEGMRFDKRGFLYGIAETRGRTSAGQSGAIFRFVPDRGGRQGALASGQLQALQTDNRQDGQGRWVDLDGAASREDADAEAERKQANEYQRPEDVETGQSTGVDRNNGANTVYVALTEGDDEGVLAIDVSSRERPFAYDYVGKQAGNASEPDFDSPDNLALDRYGNLAITEDPPGNPVGADIWIASPPRASDDDDDGGSRRQEARRVERFASLKDCAGEPTGVYFALKGTERYTRGNEELRDLVTDESLLVNRQHAGQGNNNDQLVSIAPVERRVGDEDDERKGSRKTPTAGTGDGTGEDGAGEEGQAGEGDSTGKGEPTGGSS